MSIINGSFTGTSTDRAFPFIDWNYGQDINGNFSDVTFALYFKKFSSWTGYNLTGGATGNMNCNGDYSTSNITFDLRAAGTQQQLVRQRSVRVFHNSDGSKSCFIGADGVTQIYYGNYNFGAVVGLNTIPREAYITSMPDITIGDVIWANLYNPGNLFIQTELFCNGSLINIVRHGQTQNVGIYCDSGQIQAMYAQVPNGTAVGYMVRITTWTNSNYNQLVGGVRDTYRTAYVNIADSLPQFSTYTIANKDKSIAVVDKYGTTLVTSSTQTLTGDSSKIIRGYSDVRATITAANRMVARNQSSPVFYRLIASGMAADAGYSGGDVNIDVANVTSVDSSMTAYDSRNLTRTVSPSASFSLMANYSPVFLYGIKAVRDNGVDTGTKLQFNGNFWKKYFSSDSTSNPGYGVLNTLVVQYRYKESTVAWASQTWNTITPTVDADGNISYNTYINGDLGGSGFNSGKAYNIEVRAYDKLSQTIIEEVLSTGTPVMHMHKGGIALGRRFDAADDSKIQLLGSVTLDELDDTPSNPANGTQGKLYMRSNKLILQFNDSGTTRYKYLDLTGTGVTWVHTTSAP